MSRGVALLADRKGKVRAPGTLGEDGGRMMDKVRANGTRSLYFFTKYILGRSYLTDSLHAPVCGFLQTRIASRKMLLLPREHAKTSLVSHGLPIHILLQDEATNGYIPGISGNDCRILLACETEARAMDHLRVIQTAFENNGLLRAIWPDKCWANPRRDARKWNDKELIIPRPNEYPDPSIRGIGVGGAITGAHPNVLIKDDLVAVEAANSPTVMMTAINWHVTSRALINSEGALEYIIGTRWAVNDLYQYIIDNDPSVIRIVRAAIENGKPIYPEMFTLEKLDQLRREFGIMFPLLYMNSASDPELVDFDIDDLREFTFENEMLSFEMDERDALLATRQDRRLLPAVITGSERGQSLYHVMEQAERRGQWFGKGHSRSA